MKLLILLTVVAYVSADCSSSDVLKCNSLENVFPPVNFKWPVNDADVQKLCEKLATGGKCLRDLIGNCLVKQQPNEAKFFNSVLDKEKSILTAMCASEASRGEFLKRTASCYGKKEVVEAVDNIHKRYVGLVEALVAFDDKKGNIAPLCCTQLFSSDNVRDINTKQCGKETADYVHKLVDTNFRDLFKKYCGEVTAYPQCFGKLPANIKEAFSKITSAKDAPVNKNQVALPTIVTLLHNMPA